MRIVALLILLVTTALAAPVPAPRPLRPLTDAQFRAWLAPGVAMQWRGLDYTATFSADGDYTCTSIGAAAAGWSGVWRFTRDEAGRRRIEVREWRVESLREGPGLEFSFPAEVIHEGRIGGTMSNGGECWLKGK